MADERPAGGPVPVVDQAIQREFNALREFLARLESTPPVPPEPGTAPGLPADQGPAAARSGTTVIGTVVPPAPGAAGAPPTPPRPVARPAADQVVYWWVVVHEVTVLPTIVALRERLSSLPGAIASQVVDISSREIRLGVITTPHVTRQQLEFAVTACHDIQAAEILLRTPRRAH